jgi:histidinol dehydrogenase
MRLIDFKDTASFFSELADFGTTAESTASVRETVANVLSSVREEGDMAVARFTKQFDKADVSAAHLRVSAEELQNAVGQLVAGDRSAIREAIRCVRQFHKQTLPRNWQETNPHGAKVGERFYPIDRVGLYIPGGMCHWFRR